MTAGDATPPPSDSLGGGRFRIVRRLGEGAMGVVHLARDGERGGALVALKSLHRFDPQQLYRLKREFRALADLRDAHLVTLGELLAEGETWFFTMEYVEGEDFLDWTRPRGAARGYDEARLRAAALGVARGLLALHRAGKVHRDLKPSNVIVDREGRARLLDFGLVAETEAGAARRTLDRLVGTPEYMAPEQARGAAPAPAADLYALGAMVHEAIAGEPPFTGDDPLSILVAKCSKEPPPLPADAPPDLAGLARALLSRVPDRRPDAEEAVRRLSEHMSEKEGAGGAPAVEPPPPPLALRAEAAFVGREEELAALRAAFGEVRPRGEAVSAHVEGESGLGKSALARRFLALLAEEVPGLIVLEGRCYERESVPFQAVDPLVDGLSREWLRIAGEDGEEAAAALVPRDAAPLARTFPVLRRVPALERAVEERPADDVPPQELRARAFAALRDALRRLAEKAPVVLFVDDFQRADADSLALLAEALPPTGAPPLLFLATVRTGGGDVALPEPHVRVALAPLPEAAALALAEGLLAEASGPGESALALARESHGSPLFILEMARHAARRGAGAAGAPALTLEAALAARAAALPDLERRLLGLLSIAGEPAPQVLLASAAGAPVAAALEALRALAQERLARLHGPRERDRAETYHDRVRETVAAALPEAERRALHGALAKAFERAPSLGLPPAEPELLVRHFEAAGEPALAAEQAAFAAARAKRALAFERAAALLRAALRLGGATGEARRALLLDLAGALADAGRGPEAAEAFLEAREGAPPEAHLDATRRASEALLASGHLDRGLALVKEALAAIGARMPRTPLRALLSTLAGRARIRLRGLGWRPVPAAATTLEQRTRVDLHRAVAVGLGHVDHAQAACFDARTLFLALELGERRRVGEALAMHAIYVATEGAHRRARVRAIVDAAARAAHPGLPGADPRDDGYLQAWLASARGCADYYVDGRFREAAAALAEAERLFREEARGASWEIANARLFRLFAVRQTGEMVEARRLLEPAIRDADRRGDRFAATSLVRALSIVWLAADDPDRAEREIARRAWQAAEGSFHTQHWYMLWAEAELLLYRGEPAALREGPARFRAQFRALGRSLLQRMQIVRSESAWIRGRLALAAARAAEGEAARRAHIAEARAMARRLARERISYAGAWSSLVLAGALALEGRREEAREALALAVHRADWAGTGLVAAAARRRLGELLGGDPGRALVARADESMAARGVKGPARMTELQAPGFG